MKKKRGRPKGYRKEDARRYSLVVRLHKSELKAFEELAGKWKVTLSECVRKLLYEKFPPWKWDD